VSNYLQMQHVCVVINKNVATQQETYVKMREI